MYTWGYITPGVAVAAGSLPREGMLALIEFMAAAELNPGGVGDPPGGRWPRNMPSVPFGPGDRGIVTYLIRDEDRMLLVTQVSWAA